jgi:hypothetical protein
MSHRFLAYLSGERDRLNQMVATLTADKRDDPTQIAQLWMLKLAVERHVAQWASDLLPRRNVS